MVTAQQIARTIEVHETSYSQHSITSWTWRCSCGAELQGLSRRDDCVRKTRMHLAEMILEVMTRIEGPSGRVLTVEEMDLAEKGYRVYHSLMRQSGQPCHEWEHLSTWQRNSWITALASMIDQSKGIEAT